MPTLLKNFESGGDADEPIGDLGSDEYSLAQSFTLDSTSLVNRVDLYLKKANTITDSITVRIETDAAGPKPSGTLVNVNATQTIAPSSTSYSWVSITFPASFSLTGSTKYWIKCTVPVAQTTGNRYDWFKNSVGNGYVGHGQSTSVNAGAFSNESAISDLYFRVYEEDQSAGNVMHFDGGLTIG